jgi:hypothetical protein
MLACLVPCKAHGLEPVSPPSKLPARDSHTAETQCVSLLLHRNGLAPSTACRSPDAQAMELTGIYVSQVVTPAIRNARLDKWTHRVAQGLARGLPGSFSCIRIARDAMQHPRHTSLNRSLTSTGAKLAVYSEVGQCMAAASYDAGFDAGSVRQLRGRSA